MEYTDEQIDDRVIVIDHPESFDRYTAIIDGECSSAVAMSENPFHPQGFGQHVSVDPLWIRNEMPKRVMAADLPDKVKQCIAQDMRAYDTGEH